MKDYLKLQVNDLPEAFQKRIKRFSDLFEKAGESFEEDSLFNYEMNCLRQAIAFLDVIPTREKFEEEIKECKDQFNPEKYEWETDEDFQKRVEEGPKLYNFIDFLTDKYPELWIDGGHSGNSMGFSFFIFKAYLLDPKYVIYSHGALSPLVGDEGYHDDRSDIPEDL